MPDIHFECPKCSQTLDAPEELSTQLIDCPTCKETIEVPVRSRPTEPPKPPEPQPKPASNPPPAPQAPEFKLPPLEDSAVAGFLTFIATLELIAAPIAGLIVGSDNAQAGWVIFLSGVVSGLILLGFARVIDNTSLSAQRLRRIEMLIQKEHDDKRAG
jgi:hypothetical protein